MRTKTLLLTAALCAVGVVTSLAQAPVYSVNAVGYVNVTLKAGYNLIANPLNGTNNLISTVIPTAPEGSTAIRWNGGTQQFAPADTFLAGSWYDGSFNPSATVLNPGEGFFIQNSSGADAALTFVGEVPQGNLTNSIGANYGFYSSIVPQSASLTALGFTGVEGMTYQAWNVTAQQYANAFTYLAGAWYDPAFNPVDPAPAVAEGFLISSPSAVKWGRTFSVNN
jgi:hypothetical protein